jgi:hypothetical protein
LNSQRWFLQQLNPQAKAYHYRFCPIYPAPSEIESAVGETGTVGSMN